jgi:hypothetical protein
MIMIMVIDVLMNSALIGTTIFVLFLIFIGVLLLHTGCSWLAHSFHHLNNFFKFVFTVDLLLRIKFKTICDFMDVENLNLSFRKLHGDKK